MCVACTRCVCFIQNNSHVVVMSLYCFHVDCMPIRESRTAVRQKLILTHDRLCEGNMYQWISLESMELMNTDPPVM